MLMIQDLKILDLLKNEIILIKKKIIILIIIKKFSDLILYQFYLYLIQMKENPMI